MHQRHPKPQYIIPICRGRHEVDKIGSSHSPFLSLFPSLFPTLHPSDFFAMKEGEKMGKCFLGEGVLWVQTCQEAPDSHGISREGKVPSLVCGVGHTHTHTHICVQ